jgi:hypothetical protein
MTTPQIDTEAIAKALGAERMSREDLVLDRMRLSNELARVHSILELVRDEVIGLHQRQESCNEAAWHLNREEEAIDRERLRGKASAYGHSAELIEAVLPKQDHHEEHEGHEGSDGQDSALSASLAVEKTGKITTEDTENAEDLAELRKLRDLRVL